jgi:hypothetical protein
MGSLVRLLLIAGLIVVGGPGCSTRQGSRNVCAGLTSEEFCSHISEFEDSCCGYWVEEWEESKKKLNIFVAFRPFSPAERKSLEEERAQSEFYLPAAIQLSGDCLVTKCTEGVNPSSRSP